MNNRQLTEIRRRLEREVNEQYEQVGKDDTPDGMLSLMQTSQDIGEAHQARELLRMLPEPESEAVLDYWALSRVEQMELDTLYQSPKPAIRDEKRRKGQEAREIIENRIEVDGTPDDVTIVHDPVSKMQYAVSMTSEAPRSEQIEHARQFLIDDILEMESQR